MNHETMKGLRFGIEIETVGASREMIARAIAGAIGGTAQPDGMGWRVVDASHRAWKVVPDGSLSNSFRSGEIISPILGYPDLEMLQTVVRAAREAGASVDHSTGIHIHVDGSRMDARAVTNIVKNVHKQERLIEKALGIGEARLARYCQPIDAEFLRRLESRRPRTMQELNAAWYGRHNASPARYDMSRYRGINLNSLFFRGTIEFRLFNGTLHAGEVKAYVQFALALAAKGISKKSASSKRREHNPATSKYDFRCFMLSLGLIGDEFKTARLHLMKRLGGSAAWKGERRDRTRAPQADEEGRRAA
jgi:hypothetical protein